MAAAVPSAGELRSVAMRAVPRCKSWRARLCCVNTVTDPTTTQRGASERATLPPRHWLQAPAQQRVTFAVRAKSLERSKDGDGAKVFVTPYLGSTSLPLSWTDGGNAMQQGSCCMHSAASCELQERGGQPSALTSKEIGDGEPAATRLHNW